MVFMLARRDMKTRYASSYGGFAWNIGVPLLNALTTVVVFSILMAGRMGDRYGDVSFPLFFFVPFVLWSLFNETVSRSTTVLKEHSFLIKKIAFPAWILPLVPFVSSLLNQAVLLVIVAALFAIYGTMPASTIPWLGLLWLIAAVFSIGVSYLIAAFAAYISDLAQAVPVILNIFFWLTPILYPPTLVESAGGGIVRSVIMTYNPMYYFVEISRQLAFVGADSFWQFLPAITLLSIVMLVAGVAFFRRLESGYSDVV